MNAAEWCRMSEIQPGDHVVCPAFWTKPFTILKIDEDEVLIEDHERIPRIWVCATESTRLVK